MLNYYKWLFNVNEDEERKEEVREDNSVQLIWCSLSLPQAMQSALLKIQAAQQQHKVSDQSDSVFDLISHWFLIDFSLIRSQLCSWVQAPVS